MGIKKCLAGMSLVWKKASWLRREDGRHDDLNQLSRSRTRGREDDDVQDGHVREEDADEECAQRGGYHRGVHAPRRWLLENTRSARARR